MDHANKRLRDSNVSDTGRKRLRIDSEDVKNGREIVIKPEDQKYIDEWPTQPVKIRDGQARDEEIAGTLTWETIENDGTRTNLKKLIQLKQIISVQLPKMPKHYIVRLVFDVQHRSLVALKNGKIIGGITFRPFHKPGCVSSIEIVFCVITKDEQRGGYGSRLMNQLKHWCRENEYFHLLTYADDTAIGYFQRQGFSCDIGMKTEDWDIGYLKYYDSATLMHCQVDESIEYLSATTCLRIQRAGFYKKMREMSNQHVIYPGIDFQTGKTAENLRIPVEGLNAAGWCPDHLKTLLEKHNQEHIYKTNRALLDQIYDDEDNAAPFLEPVIKTYPELAEIYLTVISDPIDLKTIEERLDAGYYITPEMMVADLSRMVENCITFQKHQLPFEGTKQKNAQKLEKVPLVIKADALANLHLKERREQLGMITAVTL